MHVVTWVFYEAVRFFNAFKIKLNKCLKKSERFAVKRTHGFFHVDLPRDESTPATDVGGSLLLIDSCCSCCCCCCCCWSNYCCRSSTTVRFRPPQLSWRVVEGKRRGCVKITMLRRPLHWFRTNQGVTYTFSSHEFLITFFNGATRLLKMELSAKNMWK